MSELLTREDLIDLLRVSRGTIRRYEREGKLKPIYLSPRTLRFKREGVENLLQQTA